MKLSVLVLAALLLALPVRAGEPEPKKEEPAPKQDEAKAELKTVPQRASYAIGLQLGESFKPLKDDINLDLVVRGIKDQLAGKPALTPPEIQKTMEGFQAHITDRLSKQGKDFLAENRKKEGITETKSGLQYKVLKEGAGDQPAATDTVVVHYRGTLVDGTEFDSSYARNEPAQFPVNRVIPGWTEALQLMKVGSKWQLCIPSEIGYGPEGNPPRIPPSAVLLFDVELISIVKKDAKK